MQPANTRRWLTNLSLLSECDSLLGDHDIVTCDLTGRGVWSSLRLHFRSLKCDALILYQPSSALLAVLSALRSLTLWSRPRLVLIDIVFTKPRPGLRGKLIRIVKRAMFSRVDLFISYMKHLPALESFYGISQARHEFVPFKVNAFARRRMGTAFPDRGYIFTGGRSRRDFALFCEAMKILGYPAVIVTPRPEEGAVHETYLNKTAVPENIQVIHDDGTPESWMRWMSESTLVVLCISDDSISPSGVGVYLQAMGLGKCVIITECPASRGILEDGKQAVVVGRRDVEGLAAAIRKAWTEKTHRKAVAERGRAYAAGLGGEVELIERFARVIRHRFG